MLDVTASLPLKDAELFRQANCIDGKWVPADSGRALAVRNPATGDVIGQVPAMGVAETRRAIEAAHAAASSATTSACPKPSQACISSPSPASCSNTPPPSSRSTTASSC